ncbi:MAG: tetratricopeptide repeat protein [Myxococcota bacterium]
MDVTCERCATVYEFDETLVSGRGTTVKCTQCGHVFKVMPPGAAPSGQTGWHLRKRDGSVVELSSLRELQQRIARGELSEDEELSRDGAAWKPLGAIAELRSFFDHGRAGAASDPATPASSAAAPSAAAPPKRERQRTRLGVGALSPEAPSPPAAPGGPEAEETRPASADATVPAQSTEETRPAAPAPRQHKRTILGMGRPAQDATPPASEPKENAAATAPIAPGDRPSPAAAGSDPPEGPWSEGPGIAAPREQEPEGGVPSPGTPHAAGPEAAEESRDEAFADTLRAIDPTPLEARRSVPTVASAPRPPSSRPSRAPAAGPAAARPQRPRYIEEDDALPRPPTRSRAWIGVLLVLLALAGGGAWVAWPQISERLGAAEPEDRLAPFLAEARQAMAEDHAEAYEGAIEELIRATAVDGGDVRVLASLSRAHALWAQELELSARDLEARATDDPALEGEAASARREAARHVRNARRYAEDAVEREPKDPDAQLALADALRLDGDVQGARERLKEAEALYPRPPADLHLVAALLDAAAADGSMAAARAKAERAVEAEPDLLRARLILARAMLAAGDVAMARRQVETVLSSSPGHPRATDLRRAIEQGVPPAAPLVEVLDGGAGDAAAPDAGVAAEGEGKEAGEAAQRSEGEDEGESEDEAAGGGKETSEAGGVPAGRDYQWYVERGDALLEQGSVGQARRYFDAALGRRPGGPEALTGLGFVALDSGNAAEAARRFQPAARSGYADAFIGLGDAYRRLGRRKEALDVYRDYLAEHPSGAHASIARNHVQQLERQLESASSDGDGAGDGDGNGEEAKENDDSEDEDEDDDDPSASDGDLPAPKDTDPDAPPPSSDPPAVGSE